MRTQFIEGGTRKQAALAAPWAAVIVRVDAGWLAFESRQDYETWRKQK